MNNQEYLGQQNEGVEFPCSPSAFTEQEQLRQEELLSAPPIEGTPSLDTYQKHMFSPDMPDSEINQGDIIYHNQLNNSQAPRKTQLEEQIQQINNQLLMIQRKVNNLSNLKKQYQQELNTFQ